MHMSRLLCVGFLLVLAVLVAGTAGCSGSDSAQPTKTVTQTEKEPRSPSGETPSSAPDTAEAPEPDVSDPVEDRDPASTVRNYFDAVNAQDYARAWELGGRNLAGSYDAYVDGFADTLDTSVGVLGTEGSTVSVRLDATQSDGSVKEFAGTYTVRDGRIVSADIREASTPQQEESGTPPLYENCDEARGAGVAPLHTGDPGYTDKLDRDDDGEACEDDRRE